jgi:hypothetical protein
MIGFIIILSLSIITIMTYKINNSCDNGCSNCKGCDHK